MMKLNDMVRKTTIDGEIVLGALLGEFEADEATIRKNLAELLDTLLAKELIVDHEA